jgi:hypothetical protein
MSLGIIYDNHKNKVVESILLLLRSLREKPSAGRDSPSAGKNSPSAGKELARALKELAPALREFASRQKKLAHAQKKFLRVARKLLHELNVVGCWGAENLCGYAAKGTLLHE